MANLMDFKVVNQRSRKYFKFLDVHKEINEIDKARLGFYLFALECITNNRDISELKEKINDTEFISIVFNKQNNDLGIDAVDIDEENKTIRLFNFKFRENFQIKSGLSQNDALISMKFVNAIMTGNSDGLDYKTKFFVDEIFNKMNSDEIWNLELCMASNENNRFSTEDPAISNLINFYGLRVRTFILDDFSNFITNRPKPLKATLLLSRNSVLTYEEEELSSSKSYLLKLSIGDLIRITSTDEEIRGKYNFENISELKDLRLDFSVLFDNVRGYLGETRFNKSIFYTLENDPTKFFMYNNGITMTAKDIEVEPVNGNLKWKVTLKGFQVVNGGQTLRTIYDFKNELYDENSLAKAQILVRVFKTGANDSLTNKIAEYTNSQNAISSVDLKSLDPLQMKIEQILADNDILYVRKAGDFGDEEKEYKLRITMEKFGQILYSIQGFPDRASNQKKKLFDLYYDEIFSEGSFYIDDASKIISQYLKVTDLYEKSEYKSYEQKIFYIMYLNTIRSDYPIEENIDLLEVVLKKYKKGNLTEARKLLQKTFKDFLVEETNLLPRA